MPKKMPTRFLAAILRDRLLHEGFSAAAECCGMIEQLHGSRKLESVLVELDLMFEAEREAYEGRALH